jgi:excisionase family DNA binding protein
MKQEKLLTISEVSELLGVVKSTLRRWEEDEKLIPDIKTKRGQKR